MLDALAQRYNETPRKRETVWEREPVEFAWLKRVYPILANVRFELVEDEAFEGGLSVFLNRKEMKFSFVLQAEKQSVLPISLARAKAPYAPWLNRSACRLKTWAERPSVGSSCFTKPVMRMTF
ncbi:TPA: hypothetical protein DDZ10_01735 [Candidatus Uhrbacteria bacterium]|nr:MAG: hypothetical protein A3D69_00570 [Candidatus Uhrbacteria bacterium RIFCSPHIGHO2_02_FULL_54_11]HBL39370.1 hypothetical protein [Candidatus Uhrbacteria bacterium]